MSEQKTQDHNITFSFTDVFNEPKTLTAYITITWCKYKDKVAELEACIKGLENENDLLETIREAQGKMIIDMRNKLSIARKDGE